MFELTMAALHTHLLPTILLQAFNNISYFHLTFLARLPAAEYQHIPPVFIGKSPQLTKSITPASPAAVSGAAFAFFCKRRDAYGSPRASTC